MASPFGPAMGIKTMQIKPLRLLGLGRVSVQVCSLLIVG
jgi:hypothetical protein